MTNKQMTIVFYLGAACIFIYFLFKEYRDKKKLGRSECIMIIHIVICTLLGLFHMGIVPSEIQ